jgi:hypothetical protein
MFLSWLVIVEETELCFSMERRQAITGGWGLALLDSILELFSMHHCAS